jgi:hypothetical protein
MARICKNCGLNVMVGQGRWVYSPGGLDIEHTSATLCRLASEKADIARAGDHLKVKARHTRAAVDRRRGAGVRDAAAVYR